MSRSEKDRTKQIQEKCLLLLNQMLRDEDNKYCVDCDAKGPRWASWNIGIFLCIRCAGIHRNLGVHISKVKSVNLDTWTPEQVVSIQEMGNSRARAVYEANLPENFRRPQTDSSLEQFIRAKYETKKYIASEWVKPPLPKVDWEKEFEEEDEKKKKKNTKITILPAKTAEIPPQLPKPAKKNPEKVTPQTATATATAKTSDLLGLDTPTEPDDFSSFLSFSAPKLSEEEKTFFNQPTTEAPKMTTDSILALYSQTPQFQPVAPQQPQFYPQFQPANSNPFYKMNQQQQLSDELSNLKLQNQPNQNLWQ